MRNDVDPQLQEGKNTTHRPRLPHPGFFSPKRRVQQHTSRV
jgi:hypothetical protein